MYVLRPLFNKFQRELLAFANTKEGKEFVSGFGGKELKENYKIVKVTPDSIHQFLGLDKKGNGIYRAVFYPRSPFIGKFAEVLTYCDIAEANKYKVEEKLKEFVIPHYLGETDRLKSILPTIYADSGTFNPDANPESTSVDGNVARLGVNEIYTTVRNGAGNYFEDDAGVNREVGYIIGTSTTDQYSRIHRGIFLFDTSSLDNTAVISAATMELYVGAAVDNALGSNGSMSLVQSTPASNTGLANSDYGNVGDTLQATAIALSAISSSAYNAFTLNATGIASISLTGITKFGTRNEKDRANSAPSWSSGAAEGMVCNYADSASNKPKLVVTYTLPVADGYFYFMN